MRILVIGAGGRWGQVWCNTIEKLGHEPIRVDPVLGQDLDHVDLSVVDRVVVATPVTTHASIIQRCPPLVLVEKPGGSSLHEFEQLESRIGGVGYVLLYTEGIEVMKQRMVEDPCRYAMFQRSNGGQVRLDCDVVVDLLCHDLATACWFWSDPAVIESVTVCSLDHVVCTLRFGTCVARFDCRRDTPDKTSRCTMIQTSGHTLCYDDVTRTLDDSTQPSVMFDTSPMDRQAQALVSNTLKATAPLGRRVWELMHNIRQHAACPPIFDPKPCIQQCKASYLEALSRVLDSGIGILGPEVESLELELCAYTKAKHAVACSNGTVALTLALTALDVGPGDQVITTPFSFLSTAETVLERGAELVFVDVTNDGNLDAHAVQHCVTPRTKCIVLVNIFGRMVRNVEAVQALGIPIIEDAAQSFGAWHGSFTSCDGGVATISCTSFYPTKPLCGFGDGGACFTNDALFAQRLRLLRNHGMGSVSGIPVLVGYNARINALNACILRINLRALDEKTRRRLQIAHEYRTKIVHPDIQCLPWDDGDVVSQFCVRVTDRAALCATLDTHRVPHRVYYEHSLPEAYQLEASVPECHRLCRTIVSLPCYDTMPTHLIHQTIRACNTHGSRFRVVGYGGSGLKYMVGLLRQYDPTCNQHESPHGAPLPFAGTTVVVYSDPYIALESFQRRDQNRPGWMATHLRWLNHGWTETLDSMPCAMERCFQAWVTTPRCCFVRYETLTTDAVVLGQHLGIDTLDKDINTTFRPRASQRTTTESYPAFERLLAQQRCLTTQGMGCFFS